MEDCNWDDRLVCAEGRKSVGDTKNTQKEMYKKII